jgi:two-component system, NarL family, sensor kinase
VFRNPVVQFLLAGLVVLAAVVIGTGRLSQSAATEEAVADARTTTEVLARSVAEPAIPRGLVDADPGAVDRFDRTVLSRLLVGEVRRIKIWSADGTVVYSDQTQLIGQRFPLGDDELEVLHEGGSDAEFSNLGQAENRFEQESSGLVEVYTRVRSPEGEPLLFEAYFSAAEIAARREQVFSAFRPITLGGLLVLVAVTVPLLWVLTRRLERAAEARERLLQAAVDASESERRRIARDLHDGVVQDLAGTAFALSAVARENGLPPETSNKLGPMGESLRRSLRSLRSLLVEIYPPDLDADSLGSALDDLVAPATSSGVQTSVRVEDLDGTPDSTVALLWRVAQEAVRNSLRHAYCRTIDVEVNKVGNKLVLRVVDDGVGFVPGALSDAGRFGLRGMHDLIEEAGGRLDVDSGPGRGTTVRLEVQTG